MTSKDIQILEDIYGEILEQEDKEFADDRNYKEIRKKLKNFAAKALKITKNRIQELEKSNK